MQSDFYDSPNFKEVSLSMKDIPLNSQNAIAPTRYSVHRDLCFSRMYLLSLHKCREPKFSQSMLLYFSENSEYSSARLQSHKIWNAPKGELFKLNNIMDKSSLGELFQYFYLRYNTLPFVV